MKRELQDYVWSVLPKEFKEEVKYKYNKTKTKKIKKECDLGFLNAHEGMFGHHNLTSDTEGEEMLICEKSKVQRAYNTSREIVKAENPDSLMYSMHTQIMCVLENIFGSKCLPDELNEDNFTKSEPKPAEPKFKVGDKVRVCSKDAERYGKIGEVIQVYPSGVVDIDFGDGYVGGHFYGAWAIEPYTEPTANYVQVDYHGADTAASTIADDCHDFDLIVNNGFRGHNRLYIAAMAMQGILANSHQEMVDMKIDKVAKLAIEAADKLISECEKGGVE